MTELSRRDFARMVAVATGAAMLPLRTLAAQPRPMRAIGAPVDPLTLVSPDLRPALEEFLRMMPPRKGRLTLADLLALRPGPNDKPEFQPAPAVTERRVAGRGGAPDVRVLVVNAQAGTHRPAILHIHGGGFVMGAADLAVPAAQAQALALGCAVVCVDYRLAPETPFPGALDDNYAALTWMHAHAAELGVDPARIAVQGESAGGGHAAMLAMAARDRGEVPLAFQALIYPMLDDRTGSAGTGTHQPPAHVGTFLWDREQNQLGWAALLGRRPGGRAVPTGAVPARVANLAGLPPAWIGVGSLDLFVDEGMEYARRLNAAAVSTELHVPAGAYHGFDMLAPDAPTTRRFRLSHWSALARAFGAAPLDVDNGRGGCRG